MIHYNIASLVPLVLTPVGGSAPKNTEVLYLYLVLALASGHGRYIAVTLLSAGFGQRPRTNAGTGSAPHQNKTVGFGQRPRPFINVIVHSNGHFYPLKNCRYIL